MTELASILRTQAAFTRLSQTKQQHRQPKLLDFNTALDRMLCGKNLARLGWKKNDWYQSLRVATVTAVRNPVRKDWDYEFTRTDGTTFVEAMLSYEDYINGDWYVVR